MNCCNYRDIRDEFTVACQCSSQRHGLVSSPLWFLHKKTTKNNIKPNQKPKHKSRSFQIRNNPGKAEHRHRILLLYPLLFPCNVPPTLPLSLQCQKEEKQQAAILFCAARGAEEAREADRKEPLQPRLRRAPRSAVFSKNKRKTKGRNKTERWK